MRLPPGALRLPRSARARPGEKTAGTIDQAGSRGGIVIAVGREASLAVADTFGTRRRRGEPGHRAALPNASLHVHQPLGGFQGQATDILIHATEIQETKRRIIRLYAQHCGRSEADVERTLDRDHFMSAQQALEWGLIDKVFAARDAA